MNKSVTKVADTEYEISRCHEIREYVLKESFTDIGLKFDRYDRNHCVHGYPNTSLVYIFDNLVVGSVRMDKKFEHLELQHGEIRLALFGIDSTLQTAGLGREFFQGIKLWCQDNNIKIIHTNSRLSAHGFWLKMGFIDNVWDELGMDKSEVQMSLVF